MPEKLQEVLSQLSDGNRGVRALSLLGLSDLSRSDVAVFREAWFGLSDERRVEVVMAMVEQGEANIHLNFHSALRACLRDANPRVRRLAVDGLWEDEKPSLVTPMVELLGQDPAVEVRAAAAISLGRFVLRGVLGELEDATAQTAEDALLAAWQRRGEDLEVRRRALEALAPLGSASVERHIDSAYFDEDPRMRQSAVFAMGRTGDGRWARQVLSELANEEPAMRFEAATAAGELGLKEAVRPLILRLDDIDAEVREAAALALGKIGGKEAKRALREAQDSPDDRLAQAAEDALEELTFSSEALEDLLIEYKPQAVGAAGAASNRTDGDLDEFDEDADEEESPFFDDLDEEDGDRFQPDLSAWDEEEVDRDEQDIS